MIASDAEATTDNLKFLPTCTVSLIMVFPIDLCWLRSQLVKVGSFGDFPEHGGRAVVMVVSPTDAVATRFRGLPFRHLSAADGSQFLTFAPSVVHRIDGRLEVPEIGP